MIRSSSFATFVVWRRRQPDIGFKGTGLHKLLQGALQGGRAFPPSSLGRAGKPSILPVSYSIGKPQVAVAQVTSAP